MKNKKGNNRNHLSHLFPNAKEDVENVSYFDDSEQTCSPSYRLAYDDLDFIMRDELRPVRLQLELLKPEIAFRENRIKSTIVIFGGSRFVDREKAEKKLAGLTKASKKEPGNPFLQEQLVIAKIQLDNAGYYSAARAVGVNILFA